MNWESFHRRGEVLRAVIAEIGVRRDGTLPMDVPGVQQTFRDELDLLGAIQLKWSARLSGWLERESAEQPMDLEESVLRAWRLTDAELPGVKAVLDHYTAHPTSPAMAEAMTKCVTKERALLALHAGRVSFLNHEDVAARIGAEIEARAKDASVHVPMPQPEAEQGLRARLKAAFAA